MSRAWQGPEACGLLADKLNRPSNPAAVRRDRLPTSSRGKRMTATQPRRTPLASKIGRALWAVAIPWWLLYYAQWHGAFGLLRLKVMCLGGTTYECAFFQQQIHGGIPVYSPVLWWAGLIAMAVGLYRSRAARR